MRESKDRPLKLDELLTVGEAAAFLGVSRSTLRNWDRQGKLAARRHPLNGYRLYEQQKLTELLERVEAGEGQGGPASDGD